MASGNTLLVFGPMSNQPPATNYPALVSRNAHLVLSFNDATAQSAQFQGVMPRAYANGGISCVIAWAADTATTGNVVWGISLERHRPGTLGTDSFGSEFTTTGAAPGTAGNLAYTTIALTDGTQMNSVVSSDHFRVKLRRVAADGSDTMTGNAHAIALEIRET